MATYRTGSILFVSAATGGPSYSPGMTAMPGTEKIYLWGDWYVIPPGMTGVVPDTSWDRQGTTIHLTAGDRVRLVDGGGRCVEVATGPTPEELNLPVLVGG